MVKLFCYHFFNSGSGSKSYRTFFFLFLLKCTELKICARSLLFGALTSGYSDSWCPMSCSLCHSSTTFANSEWTVLFLGDLHHCLVRPWAIKLKRWQIASMVYSFAHPRMTHKSLKEQSIDNVRMALCFGREREIFILITKKCLNQQKNQGAL